MKISVLAMVTTFIWELNHFNLVMNFKYQHIWVMLICKKLILRLSCFCSTPTVLKREFSITNSGDNGNVIIEMFLRMKKLYPSIP